MDVPLWVWAASVGLAIAFLVIDLVVIGRRPHVPSTRECLLALGFFVGAAILFGLGVTFFAGSRYGLEFYAGWLTEYSLSIDNLFVFLIIMAKFGVPQKFQQKVLMAGIVIALVLRAIFIGVGASVINNFAWVFYLFGAFLIYTAVKLAFEGESDDDEYEENAVMRWVEQRFRATKEWGEGHYFTREHGKALITPLFLTVLALGTTDLLFALDSIPAIFGLTKEPFLVLMANIFALMGLRQLFFLIGGLLKKLVYLGLGLAVLLAFIGVKLILHAMHENTLPFVNGGHHIEWAPDISIGVSLGAIVGILAVTTIASLWKSRRDEKAGIES